MGDASHQRGAKAGVCDDKSDNQRECGGGVHRLGARKVVSVIGLMSHEAFEGGPVRTAGQGQGRGRRRRRRRKRQRQRRWRAEAAAAAR